MRVAVSITLTHDERATLQRQGAGGEAWKRGGSCELRLCWPPPQANRTRRSPTNWARSQDGRVVAQPLRPAAAGRD